MKSSLKKSLYLGLAAVSFVAVAGTTSANASAKGVTAGPYSTLTAPSTQRNVNLTGANAVYTKPGTVSGAKTVVSKTTATKLSKSSNGQANFRAYGVKTTNRGSVYYKVVSFDGTYRGYVYGGKSKTAFANGLVSYDTTKDATAPSTTASYNLTAGTSSTANTLFFKAPSYTQYKVGRARVNGSILASTDTYKGASFTFDKAVTTSREGDTWYEIASTKLSNGTTTSDLNGAWVKASNVSNLSADPAATNDNSIKVVYIDASNNNSISGADKTFVYGGTNTKANDPYSAQKNNAGLNLSDFAKAGVPSGYKETGDVDSSFANAKFGGTVYVTVASQGVSKAALYLTTNGVTSSFNGSTSNSFVLRNSTQNLLTGPKGDPMNTTSLATVYTELSTQTLYDKTANADGTYTKYVLDPTTTNNLNKDVKYGDTLKLALKTNGTATAQQVSDAEKAAPTDPSNSNFLN